MLEPAFATTGRLPPPCRMHRPALPSPSRCAPVPRAPLPGSTANGGRPADDSHGPGARPSPVISAIISTGREVRALARLSALAVSKPLGSATTPSRWISCPNQAHPDSGRERAERGSDGQPTVPTDLNVVHTAAHMIIDETARPTPRPPDDVHRDRTSPPSHYKQGGDPTAVALRDHPQLLQWSAVSALSCCWRRSSISSSGSWPSPRRSGHVDEELHRCAVERRT
jgi:hypothetical protein